MKKILLITIALFAVNISAQDIEWKTFEEVEELQKKEPRKVMIDFYTKWCGPCKMLDRTTFKNKDVAEFVNKNFYAIKFNAEGNDVVNFKGRKFTNPDYDPAKANRRNYPHQLSRYYKVSAYPTMVFLDENMEFLTPVKGFKQPQQLELYLKMFYYNDHKTLKSQADFNAYYEAFTPEFK